MAAVRVPSPKTHDCAVMERQSAAASLAQTAFFGFVFHFILFDTAPHFSIFSFGSRQPGNSCASVAGKLEGVRLSLCFMAELRDPNSAGHSAPQIIFSLKLIFPVILCISYRDLYYFSP